MMTSKVQHRRSAVPGKVPTTAQLDLAELAVNTRDGKLYMKRDNGNGTFTVIEVGAVLSVAGKTGAVTLAKGDVGLGNVDNTVDSAKPVSGPQQAALNAKADAVRTVAAGTGLTGGGDLTANRTISADIATQAEAQDGSAAGKLMDALRVEQHMLANSLGWGQTWQQFFPAVSTSYQNTTGRPILVAHYEGSSTISWLEVSADGSTWLQVSAARYGLTSCSIVPPGWRYRFTGAAPDSVIRLA